MSFNRKEAMEYIFNSIDEYVYEKIDRERPTGTRFINIPEEDKTFLNTAKIISRQEILSSVNTCLFEYDNEKYLVIVGDNNCIDEEGHLVYKELTVGGFLFCVRKLDLKLDRNSDPNVIYNDLLYQQMEEGYNGHNYEDLKKFYPNISIYMVNKDSNFVSNDIQNILSYYFTLGTEYKRLGIDAETLELISEISLSGITHIPYYNVSQAILSSQWSHAFLDTYRCIEQMFHIVKLKKFYESIDVSSTLLEISKHIEQNLGWRPNEQDSIDEIFDMLPKEIIESFEAIKIQNSEYRDTNVCKWYYGMRNAIAHFRPIHKPIILKEEQWNELIRLNLKIIQWLYSKYEFIL